MQADRVDKRIILLICGVVQLLCVLAFAFLALAPPPVLWPFFVVVSLWGAAQAFSAPANIAFLSALVPENLLPRAVAWNMLALQGGNILGPWLGGVLCAASLFVPYLVSAFFLAVSIFCGFWLLRLPLIAKPKSKDVFRLTMLYEGFVYLRHNRLILGTMTLDLVATFLGGVAALLPAYAKDVLQAGPEAFGYLRAAVPLGRGIGVLFFALNPLLTHVGPKLLGSVLVYGLATLVFAFSGSFALSLVALMVTGAADAVSVFLRQSLLQISVPNGMRGRVSALSSLSVSASDGLGEFESGVTARLMGLVGAAAFGGAGSVVVTLLWAKLFPELRKVDRLNAPQDQRLEKQTPK